MRARKLSLTAAAVAALAVGLAPMASAVSAEPTVQITQSAQVAAAPTVQMRAAGHDGFDRVVFEFAGTKAPTKFTWKEINTQRPAWGSSAEPIENLQGKYFLHIAAEAPVVAVRGTNPAKYSLSNVKGAVVNDSGHGGTIEVTVGLARNRSYTVTPEGNKLIVDIKH